MKEHPAIMAAHLAAANSSIDPARDLLMREIEHGLERRLARLLDLSHPDDGSFGVGASRVAAYVELVQYVEHVFGVATGVYVEDTASTGQATPIAHRP